MVELCFGKDKQKSAWQNGKVTNDSYWLLQPFLDRRNPNIIIIMSSLSL
jgi:hypothetical protein